MLTLFGGLLSGAAIIAFWAWMETRRRAQTLLGQEGQMATAEITEVKQERSGSSNGRPKYTIKVSYQFQTLNGNRVAVRDRHLKEAQYAAVHNSDGSQAQAGDSVPVRYLRKDPRYCRLESLAQQDATGFMGQDFTVNKVATLLVLWILAMAWFSGTLRSWKNYHRLFLFFVPILAAAVIVRTPGCVERLFASLRLPGMHCPWWLDLSVVTLDGNEEMSPHTAMLSNSENPYVTVPTVAQATVVQATVVSASLPQAADVAASAATASYDTVLEQLRSALFDSDKEQVAERASRATWTDPLTCEQLSLLMGTTNFFPTKKAIMKPLYSKLSDKHNFDSLLQDHCRWDFEKDDMRRAVGLSS